ncbi:10451_t:CDS:2 [Dentiscutata erythropus]|uniref:10451_t:CDS:1 n=1 Tax=Dentiscutata erythropus TaxID=1348616 RepID=A0A9N9GQS2_9GLOM|nr:10451_t:CDS:2 [Dentiscutata erythropus]
MSTHAQGEKKETELSEKLEPLKSVQAVDEEISQTTRARRLYKTDSEETFSSTSPESITYVFRRSHFISPTSVSTSGLAFNDVNSNYSSLRRYVSSPWPIARPFQEFSNASTSYPDTPIYFPKFSEQIMYAQLLKSTNRDAGNFISPASLNTKSSSDIEEKLVWVS